MLDSLASMLHGGDSGPAIVPGKPKESLLVDAIKYESLEMPPDEVRDHEQQRPVDRELRRRVALAHLRAHARRPRGSRATAASNGEARGRLCAPGAAKSGTLSWMPNA